MGERLFFHAIKSFVFQNETPLDSSLGRMLGHPPTPPQKKTGMRGRNAHTIFHFCVYNLEEEMLVFLLTAL